MPKKPISDKNKIEVKPKPSPDLLPSRIYSNYVEVSQSPYDFSLKFCDATPIYNMEEVKINKGLHRIPIIAEIAIPSTIVKPLIDALQIQYNKYIEITGEANEKKPDKKK